MNLFKKRKYATIKSVNVSNKIDENEPTIPGGLWIKCKHCDRTVYVKSLNEYKVCPYCNYYFRLSAKERICTIADEGTFVEMNGNVVSKNPLGYPKYEEKIKKAIEDSGINEAVVTGTCKIGGLNSVIAVMDSNFIMGSMGSVVGEKITRVFEYATINKLPVVVFSVSGGARMQEGIVSLMQMAKVSGSINRHNNAGLFYICVMTDPTTGGVTASFASLADIILSEPNALIGFAGRRVIEQTLKLNVQLPEGFQTAEFQQKNGFLDKIVKREEMKTTIATLLRLHIKHEGGFLNECL